MIFSIYLADSRPVDRKNKQSGPQVHCCASSLLGLRSCLEAPRVYPQRNFQPDNRINMQQSWGTPMPASTAPSAAETGWKLKSMRVSHDTAHAQGRPAIEIKRPMIIF